MINKRHPKLLLLLSGMVILAGYFMVPGCEKDQTEKDLDSPLESIVIEYVEALASGDLDKAISLCAKEFADKSLMNINDARETLTFHGWPDMTPVYLDRVEKEQVITWGIEENLVRIEIEPHSNDFWLKKINGVWKITSVYTAGVN